MKFETRSKRRFGNVVERAVILCDGETFSVDETLLPRKSNQLSGPQVSRAGVLADDKKESPSLCYGRLPQARAAANNSSSTGSGGPPVRRPPGWSPIAPIRRTGPFIHWVHWVYE